MEQQILNFIWIENLGSLLAGSALTNERDWSRLSVSKVIFSAPKEIRTKRSSFGSGNLTSVQVFPHERSLQCLRPANTLRLGQANVSACSAKCSLEIEWMLILKERPTVEHYSLR